MRCKEEQFQLPLVETHQGKEKEFFAVQLNPHSSCCQLFCSHVQIHVALAFLSVFRNNFVSIHHIF